MSDTIQQAETKSELVECYLCNLELQIIKAMDVPLTTGGNVQVHPSCMEFYLSKTSVAASCGACTGDKGCC